MKGAGGTSGGIGTFFAGAAMIIVGLYLLLARVTVTTGGWRLFGYNAFGISLLPLVAGIGILFFNGRAVAGWALTGVGSLIILAGIIANLGIYLQPTSLFDTLMMLALVAGGIGLVARAVTEMPAPAPRDER